MGYPPQPYYQPRPPYPTRGEVSAQEVPTGHEYCASGRMKQRGSLYTMSVNYTLIKIPAQVISVETLSRLVSNTKRCHKLNFRSL